MAPWLLTTEHIALQAFSDPTQQLSIMKTFARVRCEVSNYYGVPNATHARYCFKQFALSGCLTWPLD
jgi:hypothetical protein